MLGQTKIRVRVLSFPLCDELPQSQDKIFLQIFHMTYFFGETLVKDKKRKEKSGVKNCIYNQWQKSNTKTRALEEVGRGTDVVDQVLQH